MDALQSLGRDHRLIARVLDAFEIYVGYVEARIPVERFDLLRFVAFFQDHGDLYHHVKEESLLFPALVAAGVSWNDDPLARLRSEHDQEHYLLSSLDHSALYGQSWSEDDRLHFLSVAKEFISFQRNHMRFENGEVFPLAERTLSEFACARLSRDMERFEEANRSRILSSTALAEALFRRYTLNQPSLCPNVCNAGPNYWSRIVT
jgi:hemerythrin-like domain-containing protein